MSETIHHPEVTRADAPSQVVLACEHGSNAFPPPWDMAELPQAARSAHIAWDPGALAVAARLSDKLDAALVAGTVSRLIYDCNRPPEAPDAIPTRSETIDIPGNAGLDAGARAARVRSVHDPFHAALTDLLAARRAPILVTVHSFTKVYAGRPRETEIGILHDADARLADAMLARPPAGRRVARNDPYGPEDGVTYTLRRHALPAGHLNVMLEIRNDLIGDLATQAAMGDLIGDWLLTAIEATRCDA